MLCAEVPTDHEDCRGWVSVRLRRDDEVITGYFVRHYDFYNGWLAMEYDPCGDEYPHYATHEFHTEAELNHFLDKTLPADAVLLRAYDVEDFPG